MFWDPYGLSTWWNPFTWESDDWDAFADGAAENPFYAYFEANEYGECNRGVTGNDSDHHAMAVRRFGENMESSYGFTVAAFATGTAAQLGNFAELLSPSDDWVQDQIANNQGFMDFLEENEYPNERGCGE